LKQLFVYILQSAVTAFNEKQKRAYTPECHFIKWHSIEILRMNKKVVNNKNWRAGHLLNYKRIMPLQGLLCFLFFFPFINQSAAQVVLPKVLLQQQQQIKSDSDRFVFLHTLSEYYFALKNEAAGDSVINLQTALAYQSGKQNLIRIALFENPGFNSAGKSTQIRNFKTQEYIQKALAYAKANALKEYEALAYAQQTEQLLFEAKKNAALQMAQLAYTTALKTTNDSVIVLCQLKVGKVYLQIGEMLNAFKTFTYAMDRAEHSSNVFLKTKVLHVIAFMYKNKLNKEEVAKQYAFQSLAVNKKNDDSKGLINDYILSGKLFDYVPARKYLLGAEAIADSIHDFADQVEAQRILFFYMSIQEAPSATFAFMNNHPDLKSYFENSGPHYIDFLKAIAYSYTGNTDSALYFFRLAEESIKTEYDPETKVGFFYEYTNCLLKQKDSSLVIPYAERLFNYSKEMADYNSMLYAGNILQKLYEQKGNYKEAYNYSVKNKMFSDSIELMTREKDVAMLEIDLVNKKRQAEAELELRRIERNHNLQYMAITIIIASIFVLLIIVGMFKVSKVTIRAMGFFAVIFLFEFIILLLDTWIHHLTHGEPWKVLLIKIGIISFMLPLHHTIEERLIHYLISKKKIQFNSRFSWARLQKLIKKSPPVKKPEGDASEEAEIPATTD
jgi:hypothetical protein